MPDWTKAMQQTFEYYVVDPNTWKDTTPIRCIESSSITRDIETDTLGTATIDATESIKECYVRIYLVTVQNGVKERHPLATVLVQSPTSDFDGKVTKCTMDAYTPLLELKEGKPPVGYSHFKGDNIMEEVCRITREQTRAPVVAVTDDATLTKDFVSDPEETWLSYIVSLMANAEYSFDMDATGRVLFAPKQDTAALQPIWTYDDGNSSILYSEISLNNDLYNIPNVVEVVYSDDFDTFYARVVNDDSNSPVSTVNRGREILYRETSPKFDGPATQAIIDEYAKRLLRNLSSIEYTLSYKHAYCGTRVGDCVRLNYKRAGLTGIKARIVSQTITCDQGCPVSEKAVFTTKLWG